MVILVKWNLTQFSKYVLKICQPALFWINLPLIYEMKMRFKEERKKRFNTPSIFLAQT